MVVVAQFPILAELSVKVNGLLALFFHCYKRLIIFGAILVYKLMPTLISDCFITIKFITDAHIQRKSFPLPTAE